MASLFSKDTSFVNRHIFPAPKPPTYNADTFNSLQTGTICWIPREDAGRKRPPNAPFEPNSIPCLFFPISYPGSNKILLFCHGNAEDLGNTINTAENLRSTLRVHVLSIEYPGYGISTGEASETALINDIVAVWTFLTGVMQWPTEDILLFGFSIGTGPTTALASTKDVGGLVLLAPYTSIRDMVEVLLPKWGIGYFASMFLADRFVNREAMEKVKCPVLIIHGKKDSIIPHTHSETLFKACKSSKKKLELVDDLDHNFSSAEFEDYVLAPMAQFLRAPTDGKAPPPRELVFPAAVFVKPPKVETPSPNIATEEKKGGTGKPATTTTTSTTSTTTTYAAVAASKPMPKEPWTCNACTFVNNPARRRCEICDEVYSAPQGSSPPSDNLKPQPQSAGDVDEEDAIPWTCSACTFANQGSAKFCMMCDTRRHPLPDPDSA